ncbi:acyl carrier protein [Streptomyces gardneri]|uniref:Actinorhodin polyketide synthase acyl carrier protein n=1 Tax=Streptomyces gardneri TaxID=66892 RepID=A0A4Y3RWF2_9ACTN|nr:acyl carrier protein [Streptomyces gardneri]WRK36556.1 acyl carrier protein [Streptomyces venezuelae]QPK45238.1 acyl carrier protein [Streptomyces gardneri]CUM41710.1 Acyl carrier protein [Streptomyces venezuelae]GEB61053.1 actinorhodin polyketide synthase acyl carrier protein [Streptomyces gardneri]GHG84102.1 actinorhodin polyketide synthase acyl carrier protein [Streptomyces gardneri]
MARLTLDTLLQILRECAGEEEGVDLGGDILDTPFVELGYDSLALLQATGRIERDFGVALPDDVVAEAETPALLLGLVNGAEAVPVAA